MSWAIKWVSENRLDGRTERLMGRHDIRNGAVPQFLEGYTKMVFRTRKDARDHIKEVFGYIRTRPDLRAEPHGWKTPVPVKVTVAVIPENVGDIDSFE